MQQEPERLIGVYRRSMFTIGFWLRFIFSLSLYYWILWPRNQITLTNRRIMQRKGGLVITNEIWINIEHVTDVSIRSTILGDLFGYADIAIQSIGSGPGSAEIAFRGLERASRLRDQIFALRDATRKGGIGF